MISVWSENWLLCNVRLFIHHFVLNSLLIFMTISVNYNRQNEVAASKILDTCFCLIYATYLTLPLYLISFPRGIERGRNQSNNWKTCRLHWSNFCAHCIHVSPVFYVTLVDTIIFWRLCQELKPKLCATNLKNTCTIN